MSMNKENRPAKRVARRGQPNKMGDANEPGKDKKPIEEVQEALDLGENPETETPQEKPEEIVTDSGKPSKKTLGNKNKMPKIEEDVSSKTVDSALISQEAPAESDDEQASTSSKPVKIQRKRKMATKPVKEVKKAEKLDHPVGEISGDKTKNLEIEAAEEKPEDSVKPAKKTQAKKKKIVEDDELPNADKAPKLEEEGEASNTISASLKESVEDDVEEASTSSKPAKAQRKRKVAATGPSLPTKKGPVGIKSKRTAKLAPPKTSGEVDTSKESKLASSAKSKPTLKTAPKEENLPKPPNRSILQLKIVLQEITPPVWRRIQVLNTDTFLDLSNHVKEVMGWLSSHMDQFILFDSKKNKPIYICRDEGFLEKRKGTLIQQKIKLSRFLNKKGDTIMFEYDFGDSWMHDIVVERVLPPPPPKAEYPKCKGGKRACPPEDCGGVPGYNHLVEVYKNPKHAEYEELIVEWLGNLVPGWDPEKFEKKAIFRRMWTWLPTS